VDQAVRWLSRAIDERSDCVVWLRVEPWLDRVRADASFGPLAVRLRRPQSPLRPTIYSTLQNNVTHD
jgi:hypothetical protein